MISVTAKGIEAAIAQIRRTKEGLQAAIVNGIEHTAEKATRAAEYRIETAFTNTGIARAEKGGHAGRIRTAAMIKSLRGTDGYPGKKTVSGVVIGYVNNPPEYTESQEYDPYSVSGVLMALQAARDIVFMDLDADVEKEINDLIRQTERGSYVPRRTSINPWRG